MTQQKISVLYLHGLNSMLHDDRREVMQKFDLEIFAPTLDYEGNPNVLQELLDNYHPDIVIGSSAGGLGGYYVSGLKEVPALLFNPALPFRHYIQEIPQLPQRQHLLQVVLGSRDEKVPPLKTFEFLRAEFDKNVPMLIHWRNTMAHEIPIDVFENEVRFFLSQLNNS